jgi:hypothetical protein
VRSRQPGNVAYQRGRPVLGAVLARRPEVEHLDGVAG